MTTPKILIIEDEPLLLTATARALQSGGYATCTAVDAIAAISTAVHERPDLVVLDFGLPAGNGIVVLERLRNLPATSLTPVIVVTGGLVDAAQRLALSALGSDVFLTKPVTSGQLLAAVGTAIERVATREAVDQR
jgi:two-component system KDP operon response regulator KdpE